MIVQPYRLSELLSGKLDEQNFHLNLPTYSLCDGFRIRDVDSWDALMVWLDVRQSEIPTHRVLLTLDDLDQACYTSGHACHSFDLDEIQGHDLSQLDAAAFEDGEHIGYLRTTSEFPIRRANFEAKMGGASFESACERGLVVDDEDLQCVTALHADPLSELALRDELYAIKVPVESSEWAVLALPNGYFTCDLNPFEVYAVARRMRTQHGYDLFGIGAQMLGFKRECLPTESERRALLDDLARLYHNDSEPFRTTFDGLMRQSCVLFLSYTE